MARMPCITPSEGSCGVVETLWIATAPVVVSASTMSVKVPPTSIPSVFMERRPPRPAKNVLCIHIALTPGPGSQSHVEFASLSDLAKPGRGPAVDCYSGNMHKPSHTRSGTLLNGSLFAGSADRLAGPKN